jgi:hypothetical protein
MPKIKLTFDQMIAAQQRSDIQRATASLAAFRNFRVQNEKHYKDRELEEMYIHFYYKYLVFNN